VSARLLIGAAGLLAAALLAAVVLWGRGGGAGPDSGRAIVASTVISPELPGFADRVTAELRVLVDRDRADPDSVRVQAAFAPYRALGPPRRSESTSGGATLLRYRYVLECLTRACMPRPEPFLLPPARLSYGGKEAGDLHAEWPAFLVVPRVQASDLARPRMRDGLRPLPEPSYRSSPDALAFGFGGAAVLLVLAAGGLVVRTRPRAAPVAAAAEANGVLSPLEAALALVRQAAAAGDPPMQRKALERLASELRRARLPRLAGAARRLAWSEPDPRAPATDALADEVERAVGERR
jgi:hypothetical protein